MILVITGTERFQFSRLVDAVDGLAGSGAVGEEFLIQLGATPREPTHAAFVRFLPFGRVLEEVRRASVVISHAGAGTALVCIQQGRHPVLVPRLARHGEAIDDHQLPFAEMLAGAGQATLVQDLSRLAEAIEGARSRSTPAGAVGRATELTAWLESFWRKLPERAR